MNEEKLKELAEIGRMIESIEMSLNDIIAYWDLIDDKLKESNLNTIERKVLEDRINVVKKQHKFLNQKRDHLQVKKKEMIESLEKEYKEDGIDIIDKMVMQLLEIDNEYMEKYHTSSSSIMTFIETLLKKKVSLM